MSDTTDTRQRWILNSPYEEPLKHWVLDSQGRATEEIQEGRRESAELVPVPTSALDRHSDSTIEPYLTINKIRKAVKEWRESGHQGAGSVSLDLLEYFASDDLEPRPFWCQRECFETLIWLLEAGNSLTDRKRDRWASLHKHVQNCSREHNEDIIRYAFKMATGTGKTKVMTMVLAWLVLVRKVENVLVITPNLAIKHQLLNLKEQSREMVPKKYRDAMSKLTLSVMNFQSFAPRDKSGFADTPAKIHRQVVGVSGEDWMETHDDMMKRLLKRHDKSKRFVVINDEAHHCRFTRTEKGEERREQKQRMMWANAIKLLHDSEQLDLVLDFSATPMYLQRQREMVSTLFPWTVTDFPLLESIESGLVKIPRLPSVDDSESSQDLARRIYENTTVKELDCRGLQNPVRELLHALADTHEEQAKIVWREHREVEPVFIVVANTIANAYEFYKYIGGYEDENGWVPGQISQFSNVRADKTGPVNSPPTVLVASNIDDPKEFESKGGQSILDEQIKVHAPDLIDNRSARAKFKEKLREMYMNVGAKGTDGEKIKCVVSVSMLTEGWDCRTVTSIFGFRQFGSSLLCEQVVGRSLRRTEHNLAQDGKLTECYANILGVPFEFMKSRDTPPPNELTHIFSIPERKDHFHLLFPCVDRYENEIVQIGEIQLDHDKVRPVDTQSGIIGDIPMEGIIGETITIRTANKDSEKSAIFRLAAMCTNKFIAMIMHKTSSNEGLSISHKREVFRQMINVVQEWWNHDKVHVLPQDVTFDSTTPDRLTQCLVEEILLAVQSDTLGWKTTLHAVLDNFEPTRSTSGIDYRTGKTNCPDTKKSEINKAVCDSGSEEKLARVLDSHQFIVRWARNEKLGLKIPWYDENRLRWRNYEPDFLAQGKVPDGSLVNLVIEFKGIEDQAAIRKREYAEKYWVPAINASDEWSRGVRWKYLYLTDDNTTKMRLKISKSIQEVGE